MYNAHRQSFIVSLNALVDVVVVVIVGSSLFFCRLVYVSIFVDIFLAVAFSFTKVIASCWAQNYNNNQIRIQSSIQMHLSQRQQRMTTTTSMTTNKIKWNSKRYWSLICCLCAGSRMQKSVVINFVEIILFTLTLLVELVSVHSPRGEYATPVTMKSWLIANSWNLTTSFYTNYTLAGWLVWLAHSLQLP